MRKYITFLLLSVLPVFALAEADVQEQLRNSAQKSNDAAASVSADRSRGIAASAFTDNGTKDCLCKLPNGRGYRCSCSDPRAINADTNAAVQNQNLSPSVSATDLIDKSSTASHINPDEWQERNPNASAPAAGQNTSLSGRKPSSHVRGNTKGATYKTTGEYVVPSQNAKTEDDSFDDALGAVFVGAVMGNALSGTTHKKTKSKSHKKTSSSPNCKSECKANGCIWQGETFTDPSTGLKGCVCGC